MIRNVILMIASLIFVGCGDTAKSTAPLPKAPAVTVRPDLLKPLVWDDKPRDVIAVTEARDKKDGESINVIGVIPPKNLGSFNPAVASIILMDAKDLEKKEVKEEFDCDDAATCPKCRKLLNSLAIYVELVDDKGNVIPSSLDGFSDLKAGSKVAFSGTLKKGAKNGPVRLIATGFSPNPKDAG